MEATKSVILQKNVGQIIPKEAYEKAAEGCNVMGVAFVMTDDQTKKNELVFQYRQHEDGVMEADSFMSLQDEFKEVAVLFFLANMPQGYVAEDIQPYTLMEGDEGAVLLAMIEGDLTSFEQKGSNRTTALHFKDKVIIPELEAHAEQVGEKLSIDGLMAHLDTVKNKFDNAFLTRGMVKVLALTGEIKTFGKGLEKSKFDWGEMSQTCGYGEKTYPEKSEETPKTSKFKFMFKKTAQEPAKVSEAKKEEQVVTKVGDTTIIHKKPDAAVADTAIKAPEDMPATSGKVWARPGATLKHDKELKKWYEHKLGTLIKGWKNRIWVMIDVSSVDKSTEVKDQTAIAAALTAAKASVPSIPVKDTETKHIPVSDNLVPSAQVEDFTKKFLQSPQIKQVMSGVQGIPTIQELEDDEKKYPTFFEKTGLHLEQTFKWPSAKWHEFFRDYPDVAKLWARAMISAYAKVLSEHPKAETKEEEPKAEVKKPKFNFRKTA